MSRFLVGETVADLVVPDDAPLGRVDLEHLAGPEAAGAQDVRRVDVDGANLGREDDAVVARHVVARRAQAVAVEGGAQDAAVGERDGRRAVPRLHEHGLVGVVAAALIGERGVLVPRLGDHERDHAVERAAVHGEELENVVEDGRVGALFVDHGHDLLEVVAEHGAVQVRLARADPGDVPAQRVYLAVVDDVAVGVRALPRGGGVRRVARVDEGKRRLNRGIVQVDEEAAHLGRHEHALVNDGTRAHGAHIEDLALERRVRVGGALDRAAADVELALEVLAGLYAVGTAQERLEDRRHAGTSRVAEVMRVDRHLAPEHERHPACGAALLEDALRICDALRVVVREEEHGNAVVALVGQQLPLFLRLLAEEAVGHLEKHAGAVAGVALKPLAASVLEVHQHRERVVEGLVAPLPLEVGDGADAAGIVLVFASIQPPFPGVLQALAHLPFLSL